MKYRARRRSQARTGGSQARVGDPVVHGGIKFRIEAIDQGRAFLHKRIGNVLSSALLSKLRWDKVAGVWRA